MIPPSAGKLMPQSLQHQETVGNIPDSALLQGWTFPVPDDDIMSCEGSEGPNTGTIMEEPSFAEASCELAVRRQRQWVCRDASGSDATQGHSVEPCAGDQTHATTDQLPFSRELHTTNDGDRSFTGRGEQILFNFDEPPNHCIFGNAADPRGWQCFCPHSWRCN